MELQVPDKAKASLRLLAEWPAEKLSKFTQGLRQTKPTLVLSDFSRQVASASGLPLGEVEDVVENLASIYSLATSTIGSKESIIDAIVNNIRRSDEFSNLQGFDWDRFSQVLLSLLTFEDSLGVTAKAISVLTDYTNVFRSCRILTDIRPIFGEKPDGVPVAAMVVHSVNFVVRRLDRFEEIFISLDSVDLQKLKALIERAEAKEKSLRGLVQNSKIQYLEPKP